MVTLTCASWDSVENIISGVWKGSLPFCSGISGIVTTPEAAKTAPGWNVVGTLILERAIKTSLKALFYVRANTCYRCPAKSKYNQVYGLVCLLTLCDQDKKEKWEEGMVALILMYVSEPTDVLSKFTVIVDKDVILFLCLLGADIKKKN